MFGEIGRPEDEPTPFFVDSQSVEDLALNPVFHVRSKHIKIKYHWYHWIREHVDPGGHCTRLMHVESVEQAADPFTKVLCGPTFEALWLGLRGEVGNYDRQRRAEPFEGQRW